MARRPTHTAEQLRELILQAATDLIEENGLSGLSAREIAKRIDYSPGTLYNVFDNLDDLILRIEGRVIDQLDDHLKNASTASAGKNDIQNLANAYVRFANQNPKLWNLLLHHQLSEGEAMPAWYQKKLDQLQARFAAALAAATQGANGSAALNENAKALFYSIHGITAISSARKVASINGDNTSSIVQSLVTAYCLSLTQKDQNKERLTSG